MTTEGYHEFTIKVKVRRYGRPEDNPAFVDRVRKELNLSFRESIESVEVEPC